MFEFNKIFLLKKCSIFTSKDGFKENHIYDFCYTCYFVTHTILLILCIYIETVGCYMRIQKWIQVSVACFWGIWGEKNQCLHVNLED